MRSPRTQWTAGKVLKQVEGLTWRKRGVFSFLAHKNTICDTSQIFVLLLFLAVHTCAQTSSLDVYTWFVILDGRSTGQAAFVCYNRTSKSGRDVHHKCDVIHKKNSRKLIVCFISVTWCRLWGNSYLFKDEKLNLCLKWMALCVANMHCTHHSVTPLVNTRRSFSGVYNYTTRFSKLIPLLTQFNWRFIDDLKQSPCNKLKQCVCLTARYVAHVQLQLFSGHICSFFALKVHFS